MSFIEDALGKSQYMGRGDSVVGSVPCVQMAAGSNPTLAAMLGSLASP